MVVRLYWHDIHVDLELSDGIISCDDISTLLELESAVSAIRHAAEERLAEAEAKAQAMLNDVTREVRARLERAEREARAVSKLGYAQGKAQAMAQWMEKAFERQKHVQSSYQEQRDYLAHWVVEAVRTMVQEKDPSSFYAAALVSLDAIADKENSVVLIVHPKDESAAQSVLTSARKRWSKAFSVRLEVDSMLAPRSCRIETLTEFIDASLSVQLQALRHRLNIHGIKQALMADELEVPQ